MSRFVTVRPKATEAQAAKPTKDKVRDYAENVAKYVPAEVIAAYLAITNITDGSSDVDTGGRTAGLVFALIFGAVVTPAYLWRLSKTGDPWRFQAGVSFVAFFVWSYSMKDIWEVWDIYYGGVAGIALVVFSVVSGFLVPKEA